MVLSTWNFKIYLSIAKKENYVFSLCEVSNEFILGFFCLSKLHFHLGPLKLVKQ